MPSLEDVPGALLDVAEMSASGGAAQRSLLYDIRVLERRTRSSEVQEVVDLGQSAPGNS